MANDIKKFVETIIKEAKLDTLPAEFLEEYTERMTIEAQKRLGVTAMSELKPEKIEELNKLIQDTNNDPLKVSAFLEENIENYQDKMTKALQEFGEEVLDSAQKLNA